MTTTRRPRLGRILLLLLLVPLVGGGISFFINRGLPTQSSEVERLSPLAVAHIQEAQHLMAETGDSVWPGFGAARIPLMVYNERYAFLCSADPALTGWESLPDQPCLRGVYPNPQAFTHFVGGSWVGSMATQEYMGIRLRAELQEVLPGPLAAVFPYGLVTPILGTDRYLGTLTHESFHAFQAETARERFDDAELAYTSSDTYWENDPPARDDWKLETTALFDALDAPDDSAAREHAREFLILRAATLPSDTLVLYEQRYEWLEGLAKYVELRMIKTAGELSGYEPLPELKADPNFHQYAGFEHLWRSELAQMKRQAGLEGDTRFYYTGMAQAVLLDRLMPDWKTRVFAEDVWLEDLLTEAIQ